MGSGARYERMAYGQSLGESKGIQEHQLAMIPIIERQAESELTIKERAFAQEAAHIETLSDIMAKVPGSQAQQIVYSQAAPGPTESPSKKYILYAAIGLAAWYFMR